MHRHIIIHVHSLLWATVYMCYIASFQSLPHNVNTQALNPSDIDPTEDVKQQVEPIVWFIIPTKITIKQLEHRKE